MAVSAGERRAAAADGARLAVERGRDGTVTIHLAGVWTLTKGLPDSDQVEQALIQAPPARTVRFDLEGLEHWDTGVLAFLAKVEDLARARKVSVDRGGLPEPVQRLLTLAEAVPEKQDARAPDSAASLVTRVGLGTQGAWD